MKKILPVLLLIISQATFAQQPDSLKIKTDSINKKIVKLENKIDTLEKKKEEIVQKDTVRLWKKGGIGSLNFSQSSFTNWAAGGENAVSGTALLNLFANYKKDKKSWDNTLDLAYGLLQSGTSALRKNEDKIDFSSKFGKYAFGDHWYYSALVNFKSQFDKGYNLPDDSTVVSHFLAPAYVLGAIGLDYKSGQEGVFSFFISPVTSKTTIVYDQKLADAGAYGVTKAEYDTAGVKIKDGTLYRSEFGGYVKVAFKKDIFKNVNFQTKLELFTDYLDHPENIDVNWENILAMKVNRFLTCTVSTQMIYDNDIPVPVERDVNGVKVPGTGPRLQFKEVLALGFSYKF
ncbi:MAG: DUF3078 domain-containing protein [Bacteroidia bacterium]